MIQGTPEWHEARRGNLTASRIHDALYGTPAAIEAVKMELILERLGCESNNFQNEAMQWGVEKENEARMAYEAHTGHFVEQVGYVPHPTIKNAGCSPDGLVNEEGLIEIKCPISKTHLKTLLTKEIDKKYISQMYWQMACTKRKWCHFVSYDPRLNEKNRLFIENVKYNEHIINSMELKAIEFLKEVEEIFTKLTG